jgi:hypothetical protein
MGLCRVLELYDTLALDTKEIGMSDFTERMKEWFRFRDDASSRTYLIAGVAGLAIVASLYFVISGFTGGGATSTLKDRQEKPVKFYCTKHKGVFEVAQKDLIPDMDLASDMAMVEEPPHIQRVTCSTCNTKTGVAMMRCPKCKKDYCPDWWQKKWGKTQISVQKPLICPHCKTDRDKYFDEMTKRPSR